MLYLVIEERNDDDELVSYAKYDITEPADISLIPLPEPDTALQIGRVISVREYYRRVCNNPAWFEPVADLNAAQKPKRVRMEEESE